MKKPTLKKIKRGFSLVELMVVIAIIGLLATVVTVSVIGQKEEADRTRVQSDMKAISDALDLHRLNVGNYPSSLEGLMSNTINSNRWKGPYLKESPVDPWGNAYEFTAGSGRAGDYEITSYGADGAPGGVEVNEDLSSKTINQQGQNQ